MATFNSNDYLDKLYGGKRPSMDYYFNLGKQKRDNEIRQKEAEKRRKEREKEREKKQEAKKEDSLDDMLNKRQKDRQEPEPKKERESKKEEEDGGFFDTVGNLWGKATDYVGDVASDAGKDTGLSNTQLFTRGAGNLIDSAVPFTDPVKDGVLKTFDDNNWLKDTFKETDNKALGFTDVTNKLAGDLVPGAGAYKATEKALDATKGISSLAKVSKPSKKTEYFNEAQKGFGTGMGWGVQNEVGETLGGRSEGVVDSLNNIAFDSVLGAVADPALKGIFDAVPAARKAMQKKSQSEPQESYSPLDLPSTQNRISQQATGQTTSGRMDSLDNLMTIQNNKKQMDELDPLINERNQEFENNLSSQVDETKQKQRDLADEYENMRQSFIDEGRKPYSNEQEIADATQKWSSIKQISDEYDRVRKNSDKFFIPKDLKEEFEGKFPKSFIASESNAGKHDVFNAAEEHGFEGSHEGALKLSKYLKSLQSAKNTRKKDLVPKADVSEKELKQIDDMNAQAFEETPDAQGMKQVIDSFDDEANRIQGQAFADTDEYTSIEQFRKALEDDTRKKQSNINSGTNSKRIETENNRSTYDRNDGTSGREKNSNMNRRDGLITRTTDDLHPILKTEEKLNRASNTFYKDSRVSRGAGGAAESYINDTLSPAVKKLESAGKLKQGNDYINAKHLLRITQANPDYQIPGKVNEAQLRKTIARNQNDPDIQEFSNSIKAYTNGILDMLEESGVLNEEARIALQTEYPDYVPLFRNRMKKKAKKDGSNDVRETNLDDVFDTFSQMNKGNVRKSIQELSEHGSQLQTKNPMENLTQYGINAFHASFSNRAMQNLSDLNGVKLNGKEVSKKITKSNKSKYDDDNFVSFFENGESVQYYVNDDFKRSLDSMKGIMQFDEVSKFLQSASKLQRQSITANPLFAAKQIIRDIPQSWQVGSFSLVKDLVPAFIDSISQGSFLKSQGLKDFYRHGGGLNNIASFDRSSFLAIQRASNKTKERGIIDIGKDETSGFLRKQVDRLRQFNEALENTPKLAQYRATARKTGDLDEAAYQGRDIMDFSRSGENVRNVNRYVAFMNATIQGKSKQLRALRENPMSAGMKLAAGGALPSILAYQATQSYASEEQKQIINESPEWQRQTYWLIPSLTNDKNVVRIPKPYDSAVLSSSPVEFLLNNEDKVGTDGKDFLSEWFNQAVGIGLDMNIATPLYETALNRDSFTGQDIIPQREQNLPKEEQGDVNTSSLARLGTSLSGNNVSPRTLDHLLGGYLPIAGETGTNIMDATLEKSGVRENAAPSGARDTPFINQFRVKGDQYQANELIGDAYDTRDELKAMKQEKQGEGQEFPFHNAYRASRSIAKDDSDMSGTIRSVENDPNLSADEKSSRLEGLYNKRNENVRQAQESGLFNTDTSNLKESEAQLQGLGAEPTKTDMNNRIVSTLTNAGVPQVDAEKVIQKARDAELSGQELAKVIKDLIQSYN